MLVRATEANIAELFEGVMVPFDEPFIGVIRRPGWRCKRCGWTFVAVGLPIPHECQAEEGNGDE